jgi:hypothetical protein
MDIQLGYWRWKVYRWNEHPNPFRGRADLALEWLRRFRNDRLIMSELRATLSAAGVNGQRSSDDNHVLEEVAARLSSGEFYVCAESSYPFHTAAVDVTPADAPDTVVEPPPPAAPAPAPKPAPETEPEPTLPQDADPAAIAQALQQAAQTGTPFCAECEKAKALAKAHAPVEESTLPDSADAEEIAESLQAASRTGTPFCAECEKARAQAAKSRPQPRPAPAPQLQPAPPPESTLPDSADAVAIAQSLQTASRKGTPFCEECERARLAAMSH